MTDKILDLAGNLVDKIKGMDSEEIALVGFGMFLGFLYVNGKNKAEKEQTETKQQAASEEGPEPDPA